MKFPLKPGRSTAASSFIEVLMAVVIVALVFGVIIKAYIVSATRAQWTGYSLAAQTMSGQMLEQTRSAVWDIALGKNEVTNLALINYSYSGGTLTGYTTNILDIPWKGTNYVVATNFVTIQTIYENNYATYPVQVQIIRVDTIWPFTGWGNNSLRFYTNSVCSYMAPDNRDPSTLGD